MRQLSKRMWLFGELGLFVLPENVERSEYSDAWKVTTSMDTFWEFPDVKYGNHLHSLHHAVAYAITLGSLPYELCLEHRALMAKDRLSETGVPGVYYRAGLKEQYVVAYCGQFHVVPYCKGKGFTRAVKLLDSIKVAEVEYLRSKLAPVVVM